MSEPRPRVGFVGLGAMGSRMAANLVKSRYSVVVYNRTSARTAQVQAMGADAVRLPAEVADRSDIVCGCLLNGAAIDDVYCGEDGLIGNSRPGQVYIEHGTFAPQLARTLARRLTERGATLLDAPVTGGPEAAAAGSLTIMLGGAPDAVARASEVLRSYAARICHVGGPGAGVELKLVNQLLVSCHVAAAAEATALLRRLQVPLTVASEVLGGGWASSAMLQRALVRLQDDPEGVSEATIGGLLEPQELSMQLASDSGITLTVLPAAMSLFRRAHAGDLGAHDLTSLVELVETLSARAPRAPSNE